MENLKIELEAPLEDIVADEIKIEQYEDIKWAEKCEKAKQLSKEDLGIGENN